LVFTHASTPTASIDEEQVSAGNNSLAFHTKSATVLAERMRIHTNGYVGIGTATPNRLLEVAGPMRLTASTVPSSPATGDIYIDSADSNNLKWYNGSAWQTVGTGAGAGDLMKDGSVTMTGNFRLGANQINNDGDAEGLSFDTAGRATLTGTTAADYPLSITNLHTGAGSSSSLLMTSNGTPLSQIQTYVGASTAESYMTIATRNSGTLAEKVRISKEGYVGVGTTTPAYPVDVKVGASRVGVNVLSGAAGNWTTISVGRTGSEGSLGVAGGSNNFLTGTVAGDIAISTTSTGRIHMGSSGNAPALTTNGTQVGIGTISPNRLLEVAGPIRVAASAAPTSPAAGDIYIDSGDSNKLKWYNGSAWQTAVAGSGAGDFMKDGSVAMTGTLKMGGNTIYGSAASGGNLTLQSTSDATKGSVVIDDYAEINDGLYVAGGVTSGATVAGEQVVMNLMNYSNGADRGPALLFGNGATSLGQISSTRGPSAATSRMVFSTTTGSTFAERMRIDTTGYVGVGTTTPRSTLDVNGTLLVKPAVSVGATTVDFGTGNLQYTAGSCGAGTVTYALHNMKDGGSYTFAVKGDTSGTCAFNAYSDAGTTSIAVHLPVDHGLTTPNKDTLYTFLVMGSDVYVSWMPGL
jgi:hypothetical protein